jgi:hypothetical protein
MSPTYIGHLSVSLSLARRCISPGSLSSGRVRLSFTYTNFQGVGGDKRDQLPQWVDLAPWCVGRAFHGGDTVTMWSGNGERRRSRHVAWVRKRFDGLRMKTFWARFDSAEGGRLFPKLRRGRV